MKKYMLGEIFLSAVIIAALFTLAWRAPKKSKYSYLFEDVWN